MSKAKKQPPQHGRALLWIGEIASQDGLAFAGPEHKAALLALAEEYTRLARKAAHCEKNHSRKGTGRTRAILRCACGLLPVSPRSEARGHTKEKCPG